MRTNGFIQLHRSILAWNYHNNPCLLAVWVHLLLFAEYDDREQDGITIHRGELLVSQQWLAEYIGISRQQLRNCLSILESTNEITKKKTGNITMLKIVKYDEYQQLSTNTTKPSNHDVNHSSNQEVNHKERNINNNKKNLSDGEIQKSDIQVSTEAQGKPESPVNPESPESPENPVTPVNPVNPGSPENPVNTGSPAALRSAYTRQLAAHDGWKHKCCRDYRISPELIERHIIAFHEHLVRNMPNKSWLSLNDFCLHFHSWLRFQTPESIKRLATQAIHRSRQQMARKVEEERQAEMWKGIEEAKSRAVSYEEYKKRLVTSPVSG